MEPFKYTNIADWTKAQKTTRTAAELAGSGIPVFPCNPDKTPMTAHGFKDADTDRTRIALFFRDPLALIAMPTGLRSNIDVIDEDPRNGGNLDTLAAARGPMPMDVVARTRSGGRHVFTKHRPGNKMLDILDRFGMAADPELIAESLYQSGSLPYRPTVEEILAARGDE